MVPSLRCDDVAGHLNGWPVMSVTRRPARPHDVPFLNACFLSSMRDSITASRGEWDEPRERTQFERQLLLESTEVISVDGTDVGFVMWVHGPQDLRIHTLCVLPAHQGRGIGSRVTLDLVAASRQTGQDVVLSVLRTNHRAEGLYRRLGFAVIGETEYHRQMKFQV